jgi:hypothetical protein
MPAGLWNIEIEQGETWNPQVVFQSEYRAVDDASIAAAGTTLTSNTAAFSAGDAGKSVSLAGAGTGRGALVTTIASVTNPTTAVLSVAATFAAFSADLDIYVPVNLTSFTARMSLRDKTAKELLSLTTANGRITLGGTAGSVTFLIAATDSAKLPFGVHSYDVDIVSGGGVVTKFLKGSFTVLRERTI